MRTLISQFVLTSVTVLGLAVGAYTQDAQHQQTQPSADIAAKCKAMMADRQKMMEEMKAADQRLDELLAKMNSASGQAKVDATAAAVTELAAQRKAMRDRMTQMHQGMMTHMGEHMQAGPQSMAMCPMMKMGSMRQ